MPRSSFRRIASAFVLIFGQLDADHETPLTDIGHVSEREKILLQPLFEIRDPGLHPLDDIFLLEKLKARQSDSAPQGVTRVGMTVKESFKFLILSEKGRKDLLGRERSQPTVDSRP